ncbi:MAG: tyrosine--tRNA ligase [Parachlamydiales bacterium]
MSHILDILEERELVEQATSPELRKVLERPTRLYLGFDPTADSLHLGSFMGIMVLAHFQRCGHIPYALVGGATGLIGDPSGKSHERPLLDEAAVAANCRGIQKNLETVLTFEKGRGALVNNIDWLGKMGLIPFLRDVGKHFRMGPMLGKEMVRTRLNSEEGLSYTEFSYQLFQAYDFLHLYKEEGVVLQLGGSDQWGNITAGTELIRKLTGESAYGLTFPLLVGSDGKKFGKSEGGAIFLSRDRLAPYDFYQYLVRMPDADVIKLMKRITFIEMEEIRSWERKMGEEGYLPNSAQRRLAEAVTEIIHGRAGVEEAERVTASVAPGAGEVALTREALAHVPSVELPKGEVVGHSLLDLLVQTGLVGSKGEARRLMANRGVSLNNEKIEDERRVIGKGDLIEGELLLLAVGKKKRLVINVA